MKITKSTTLTVVNGRIIHRSIAVFVVALVSLVLGQGASVQTALAAEHTTKQPSTMASIVAQRVASCYDAVAAGSQDLSGLSGPVLHVTPDGYLELRLNANRPIGADELEELKGLGAKVVAALSVGNLHAVQAWISYHQVKAVAVKTWVQSVMPPDYGRAFPHPVNPFNSEGVAIHGADLAQAAGLDGSGITVGAISDGFNTPGDNPLVAIAPGCVGGGGSAGLSCSPLVGHFNIGCAVGDTCTGVATGSGDEGTAMAEIVHDMAPGASLQFAEGLSSSIAHVIALLNLAAGTGLPAASDIVTEDIGFFAEPVFQQGLVALVGDAINLGLCSSVTAGLGTPFAPCAPTSLHSSSGNQALVHWRSGPTGLSLPTTPAVFAGGPDGVAGPGPSAACPFLPATTALDFADGGGNTTLDIFGVAGDAIFLQWSEPDPSVPPFTGAFTDLDLYLMDPTLTTCFASSFAIQGSGSGAPFEALTIPSTRFFKVVVNLFGSFGAAGPPVVDLKTFGLSIFVDPPVLAASITGDSNYVFSAANQVGAVRATPGTPLEPFSSQGPITLGTTTPVTGFALDPAGVTPAFMATDGVTITGAGGFGSPTPTCPAVNPGDCRFFGTSASAPHAAGCEALVREGGAVAASPAALKGQLASTATDIPPASADNISGAGLLNCLLAATIQVDIDIKPGSDPNSIKLRSKGVIPVAILTTAVFDATTVDPLSVQFGPDGATESHGRGHIEDVDGDGDLDLVLHFKTRDTGIASAATEACLNGATFDGTPIQGPIQGCDAVRTL